MVDLKDTKVKEDLGGFSLADGGTGDFNGNSSRGVGVETPFSHVIS